MYILFSHLSMYQYILNFCNSIVYNRYTIEGIIYGNKLYESGEFIFKFY